jgi:hypothetical protein
MLFPNYSRKAQAPYNKINKNSVITEFKNSTIIGWVLVALDAKVGQTAVKNQGFVAAVGLNASPLSPQLPRSHCDAHGTYAARNRSPHGHASDPTNAASQQVVAQVRRQGILAADRWVAGWRQPSSRQH